MPLSDHIRQLMLWASDRLLPTVEDSTSASDVQEGVGEGQGGVVTDGGTAGLRGTPGKSKVNPTSALTDNSGALSNDSPMPMPPPRSRARGGRGSGTDREHSGAATGNLSPRSRNGRTSTLAQERRLRLAEGLFGVVLLLASEWVALGCGLAEISVRCNVWGQRLLSLLLRDCEGGVNRTVSAILPHLCRLTYQLSLREAEGTAAHHHHQQASMWEVLLRCIDVPTKGIGS
ncbi:unnamed protein product, partial [Discosporangium mesarthrocarpum]